MTYYEKLSICSGANLKGNKDGMLLVFHVITSILLLNLSFFFKKYFDLISSSSQWGISMNMKGFVKSDKLDGILKLSSHHSLMIVYTTEKLFIN